MYRLPAHRPERELCFVLYDGALDSFAVWVMTTTRTNRGRVEEFGRVLLLAGALPGEELRTVEEVEQRLAPYATLTEEVKESLRGDRARARGASASADR